MIKLFGPQWFLGVDELLDIFSVIASLLLVWYSWKVYRATEEKNAKNLSIAFSLIGLSFLVKIITNFMVYQEKLEYISCLLCSYASIDWIYALGYFFYRLFFIVALILLFAIALRITDKRIVLILGFLSFMLIFFSHYAYYIFHLTAAVLLFFIMLSYQCNYLTKKSSSCLCVYRAFSYIFLSQVFFIFVLLWQHFYILGEITQLIGYIYLIINHLNFLKK